MQQLSFSLVNPTPAAKGQAILYSSGDADLNKLHLTLTNTGPDLKLGGGAPVPEDQLPKGRTGLYLSFGQLLKDKGKGLQVSANGWAGAYTPDGQWALSPVSDLLLKEGDKVVFALAGFNVDSSQVTGYLTVDYLGFSGLRDNSTQLHVAVAEPPTAGNKSLHDVLSFELNQGHNEVFLTANPQEPLANNLSFSLRNGNKEELLMGGPNTIFTISAVYGESPGYGALCTAKQGTAIKLSLAGGNDNDWTIMENKQGEVRSWSFEPHTQLLGKKEAAIQQINLAGLVSTLEPGLTSLYLSWVKLPGYNGGSMSLELEKKRQPEIKLFTATPDKVVVKNATEKKRVNLEWEVANYQGIPTLNGEPVDNKGTREEWVSTENNEFILSAVFGGAHYVKKQVKVDVTIVPVPVPVSIYSFNVDPQSLDLNDSSKVTVKINWSVEVDATVSISYLTNISPVGESSLKLGLAELAPLPNAPLVYGVNLTLTAKFPGKLTAQQTRTIYASRLPITPFQGWAEWTKALNELQSKFSAKIEVVQLIIQLIVLIQHLEDENRVIKGLMLVTFDPVVPLLLKLKEAGGIGPLTNEDIAGASSALKYIYDTYVGLVNKDLVDSRNLVERLESAFTALMNKGYFNATELETAKLFESHLLSVDNSVKLLINKISEFAKGLGDLIGNLEALATASGSGRANVLLATTTACEQVLIRLNAYSSNDFGVRP